MQDFLNKSNRGITSVKSVTYSYTQELRTTLFVPVTLPQLACAEDGWEREMVLASFPPPVTWRLQIWRERPGRDLTNKQQHIEVLAFSCSELLGNTYDKGSLTVEQIILPYTNRLQHLL